MTNVQIACLIVGCVVCFIVGFVIGVTVSRKRFSRPIVGDLFEYDNGGYILSLDDYDKINIIKTNNTVSVRCKHIQQEDEYYEQN